jgi:hypothetical protein
MLAEAITGLMSREMFVGLAIAFLICVILFKWVFSFTSVANSLKSAPDVEEEEDTPFAGKECCGNCKSFDIDEGQAVIRKNPVFLEAASHVSPNTMMRKLDENGNELRNPQALRAKDDNWASFGACETHEQLRHRSDHCEQWVSSIPPKTLVRKKKVTT